jgi:hypothetical protein
MTHSVCSPGRGSNGGARKVAALAPRLPQIESGKPALAERLDVSLEDCGSP